MSGSYGENIRVTVFGTSHGCAVGVTMTGLPAGERIELAPLRAFLARRAPGGALSTARRETDEPELLSGLTDGVTNGTPLTAILRNADARPQDYDALGKVPRPGHADFAAWAKYGDAYERAGGGQFSGRMTAPLCLAGGVCLQLLARAGVSVRARAAEIAGETDAAAMEA
ncbi:MAG: chorismate synthase, partial [Oscillospiraceae bacterium]|nr:chorismate synthase [Oscillospiraceae bacterium]